MATATLYRAEIRDRRLQENDVRMTTSTADAARIPTCQAAAGKGIADVERPHRDREARRRNVEGEARPKYLALRHHAAEG